MVKKSKTGSKSRKFNGKKYSLDWEVSGKGHRTWANVRKQELREKGYSTRVVKGKKKYQHGKTKGTITVSRVYKRRR